MLEKGLCSDIRRGAAAARRPKSLWWGLVDSTHGLDESELLLLQSQEGNRFEMVDSDPALARTAASVAPTEDSGAHGVAEKGLGHRDTNSGKIPDIHSCESCG
jgi:hypothetical protein